MGELPLMTWVDFYYLYYVKDVYTRWQVCTQAYMWYFYRFRLLGPFIHLIRNSNIMLYHPLLNCYYMLYFMLLSHAVSFIVKHALMWQVILIWSCYISYCHVTSFIVELFLFGVVISWYIFVSSYSMHLDRDTISHHPLYW